MTSDSSIHNEFVDIILVGVMGKRNLNLASLVILSSVAYNEFFFGFSLGNLSSADFILNIHIYLTMLMPF